MMKVFVSSGIHISPEPLHKDPIILETSQKHPRSHELIISHVTSPSSSGAV